MRKIILAALIAAAIAPAAYAAPASDDKPRVFVGPVIVEPACVPGECSGK